MSKHPETFWNDARDRLLGLADKRTRESGRLGRCEAMTELRVSHRVLQRLLRELFREGKLINLGTNLGVAVPGVCEARRSLAGLLLIANGHLSADANPRPGRKCKNSAVNTAKLSRVQLTKMRTAVGFVEGLAPDADGSLSEGPFERHPVTEDWALLHRLERGHLFRRLGTSTQRSHRSALRLLLAFAENEGLLGSQGTPSTKLVLAAEWVGWIDRHRLGVGASKPRVKRRLFGLRVLARLATSRGWLSAHDVDWAVVLSDLAAARDSGLLSRATSETTVRVYRFLHRAALVSGPPSSSDRCLQVSLVTQETIRRGVTKLDYSDWRTRDGASLSTLAAELKRHHLWRSSTIPASRLRLEIPPLPSRSFGTGRGAHAPFVLAESSMLTVWNRLLHYAGWLVAFQRFNTETVTLQSLTSLDPWELFSEESLLRRGLDAVDGTNSALSSLAQNLGVLADPFLAREARQRGDNALAAEMETRGLFFRAESLRLQPSRGEFDGAKEKIGAWESDGTSGYQKLDTLRQILEASIVSLAYRASIKSQLAELREGRTPRLQDAERWAAAVRDYVMLSILRRVPLRVSNLVALQITDAPPQKLRSRKGGDKCEWWVDDMARPWEGPITLRIAHSQSKNDDPASLPLITRNDCGSIDAEQDLGRDVFELYLLPAGARTLLLDRTGEKNASKYVLVASTRKRNASCKQAAQMWRPAGASRRFTELVSRHCRLLGLDHALASTVQGALSIHVVRHLFGSWFTEHEHLDFAAAMLMHSSTDTLERHYRHLTPRALSIDKRRRSIA